MIGLKVLDSFDPIHTLSNPHRQKVLQMLMSMPMTISQLGRELNEYPAGIRHHVMQLEKAGLVFLVEVKASNGYIEKYYRASSQAFLIQKLVLSSSELEQFVFMGSHDLGFENLIAELELRYPQKKFTYLPIGSLDGLMALRQGLAHMTGCHIIDAETGQYNHPYIKHFFPDREMRTFTLAHREQGLIIAPGNPKGISGLLDLSREDITFINRNRGSGTRIWLDNQLVKLGILPESVNGYTQEINSHCRLAQAIKDGSADVGLGLRAAAAQEGLDFIPLLSERYDLVFPKLLPEQNYFELILDHLDSAPFRQSLSSLPGYDAQETGKLQEL